MNRILLVTDARPNFRKKNKAGYRYSCKRATKAGINLLSGRSRLRYFRINFLMDTKVLPSAYSRRFSIYTTQEESGPQCRH